MQVAAVPVDVEHLAEQQRAPVAQARLEVAELVAGVGLRDGGGARGRGGAGEHRDAVGAAQGRGIGAELVCQGLVEREQARRGHRRARPWLVQALELVDEGALEREQRPGGDAHALQANEARSRPRRRVCRLRGRPFVSYATIPKKEDAMKYMLLIHHGTTPVPGNEAWDALPDAEKGAIFAAYKALRETPGVTSGEWMQTPDMATTVRVQDGKTLTTDGPFAEMKEAIGGYCFYEADDLDAAIEVASRIPAAYLGGAIEVRPLVER